MDLGGCVIHRFEADATIDAFDCGDKDLNDFIKHDAANYAKQKLAYSYVMLKDSKVIAYFSLANDRISVDGFETATQFNRFRRHYFVNAKRRRVYPAAKLCRLAVDVGYRGCRIGSSLLNMVKVVLSCSSKSACRFLTVDAYQDVVEFYHKNGFVCFNENDISQRQTIPMYFDLCDYQDFKIA